MKSRTSTTVAIFVLFLFAFVSAQAKGPTKANFKLKQYLRDTTVQVRVKSGASGTGSLIKRNDKTFVLTAGHVVDGGASTDGKRWLVWVEEPVWEDDVRVGTTLLRCDVLYYSPFDVDDLALLLVRKKNYGKASVRFYDKTRSVPRDTPIWHCGNFQGNIYNAIRKGAVEQIGIEVPHFPDVVFDSGSFASFHGSSGGPVVLKDGRYIGMLTRGDGETDSVYVPIRRISKWLKKHDADYIVDPKAALPTTFEPCDVPSGLTNKKNTVTIIIP